MIINMKHLSMAEVKDLVENLEDKKELQDYLKKFKLSSKEDSEKLADELRALGNLRLSEEYIIKIVDFAPKDGEELNKIFIESNLSEGEINQILEIAGKHRK